MTLCFVAFGLAGCDLLRQQIASMVQSKTPQELLASAQQLLTEGRFSQALEQVEPLTKKPGELQSSFSLVAAQALARMGKTDEALSMLDKAIGGGSVEPTSLITHPDFESLRTDVRFLALLTHHGVHSSPAATPSPAANQAPAALPEAAKPAPTQAKASESVSVEIGPGGVSAKAGSVSVKLPP